MMDFAGSIKDDFSVVDGIDRVTVRDESANVTATDVAAKRSDLSYRELAFGGGAGYDATDVVWRLWASTMPFVPKPGDIIRESTGDTWTIQSVVDRRIGGTLITHRCVCKRRG